MSSPKVFTLQHYKNFSCIGSKCRLNCCRNWIVPIDEAVVDKLKACDDERAEEFLRSIKIVSENPFSAQMVMDESGVCPMLSDRGLCNMHLHFGEDYLAMSCRYYPRKSNLVGGDFEVFLELSCEAAAELALFDKGFMNFEEIAHSPFETAEAITFHHKLESERYFSSPDAHNVFWKLRVASVAIVQSRKFKLRVRMLILCMFINECANLIKANQAFSAVRLADDYMQRLDTDFFDSLARDIPGGTPLEPLEVLDILSSVAAEYSHGFNKMLDRILRGLGISSFIEVPEGWLDEYLKYYSRYFSDKEYMFENYIVHSMLSEGFPFNYKHEAGVMENYIKLLVKYNVLEFLLVGQCRSLMKFDKRSVLECIVRFARSYEHRTGYQFLRSN